MNHRELSRFLAKVEVDWPDIICCWKDAGNYCWLWTASTTGRGYGQMKIGGHHGAPQYAHRLAYEHWVGAIPPDMELDHLCRNRRCVNPAHLEAVTSKENQRRGLKGAALTHCPSGHAYDDANTGHVSTTGWRYCRACAREKQRRYKSARRERA